MDSQKHVDSTLHALEVDATQRPAVYFVDRVKVAV